jgi:beta-ureidopropionase / N-carbamoyl-L-amino-acid hydrolase
LTTSRDVNSRDGNSKDCSMAAFDGNRVLADLYALRGIGAYKSGVHRPSLSAEHVRSLHWLADRLPDAHLAPAIDGIGNVFGRTSGKGPKLLAGSHLESQNYAGWLDGPLGVVYALEASRVINTDADGPAVEVAAWFDEEGHFGNFLGSRSYCNGLADADIDAAVDRTDGRKLRDALAAADLAGVARVRHEPGRHVGYLEAHIEQGDWLESHGLAAAVVTSIVGIWQYRITIDGSQNHAGTTRMAIRQDAGLAAAKLLVAIDAQFPPVAGPRTVWTTGRITLDPGAPSIIPGRAEVLFQIRDADPATLQRMEQALFELAAQADKAGPCRVHTEAIRKSHPALMDARFQSALAVAAEAVAPGRHTRLPSGAGHDAQILSTIMPAGMLFVPSMGGISHHWTENTSDADIVCGAEIFVSAARQILNA